MPVSITGVQLFLSVKQKQHRFHCFPFASVTRNVSPSHFKHQMWNVLCFVAPESYEELKSLLSGKSTEEQLLVVERIQKCNHPSLAVGNKAKLEVREREGWVGGEDWACRAGVGEAEHQVAVVTSKSHSRPGGGPHVPHPLGACCSD